MLASMSLSRRFLVLMLGAILALGMSLSAVRAGEMPVKMSMMAAAGMTGHCKACGDKDGAAKVTAPCTIGCAAPVLAVIPQTAPMKLVHERASLPEQDPLVLGRISSPDPDPPRSDNLG